MESIPETGKFHKYFLASSDEEDEIEPSVNEEGAAEAENQVQSTGTKRKQQQHLRPRNKKTKKHAKPRKLSNIKSQEDKIEIVGESGDNVEKPTPVKKDGKDKASREEFYNRGRLFPHQRDQKKERELKKTAGRAVVQIFNFVSQTQAGLNPKWEGDFITNFEGIPDPTPKKDPEIK